MAALFILFSDNNNTHFCQNRPYINPDRSMGDLYFTLFWGTFYEQCPGWSMVIDHIHSIPEGYLI